MSNVPRRSMTTRAVVLPVLLMAGAFVLGVGTLKATNAGKPAAPKAQVSAAMPQPKAPFVYGGYSGVADCMSAAHRAGAPLAPCNVR